MTPPFRSEDVSAGDEFDVLEAMEAMDVAAADREIARWEAAEQDEAEIEAYLDGRE